MCPLRLEVGCPYRTEANDMPTLQESLLGQRERKTHSRQATVIGLRSVMHHLIETIVYGNLR